MAKLQLQSGNVLHELEPIRKHLTGLNIELSHWPIERTATIGPLLAANSLNDSEKEQLLVALDHRFKEQQQKYGYQSRDLIVLHAEVPQLDDLLAKFDKMHTHDDDEVRYIVDGAGKFGFIIPDGNQALLTVEAGEYIRVPKDTKHWFILDGSRRIKAIRYFTSKDGWVANYTGEPIHV